MTWGHNKVINLAKDRLIIFNITDQYHVLVIGGAIHSG